MVWVQDGFMALLKLCGIREYHPHMFPVQLPDSLPTPHVRKESVGRGVRVGSPNLTWGGFRCRVQGLGLGF